MHYQHHHHTTILHNNPSMLANKCKIDLYLPFNQMIPTTMQVVNHFQALIMVPYLMLQKKEVQYIDTNILANYHNKTKLGLQ